MLVRIQDMLIRKIRVVAISDTAKDDNRQYRVLSEVKDVCLINDGFILRLNAVDPNAPTMIECHFETTECIALRWNSTDSNLGYWLTPSRQSTIKGDPSLIVSLVIIL